MTIKSKLIANVLVTAAIIVAISMASYFSMRFLQGKLSYLTERSTPFQMRTIELQREMQGSINVLIKVNAARTLSEFMMLQSEAERLLYRIADTEHLLEKMKSGSPGVSDVFDKIALELFAATEERIKSSDAAASANAKLQLSMKESSARLSDLESYISNLQANYSRSFAAALEKTGTFSERLRSVEELRNRVRDLQLVAVSVNNSQNGSAVLIAKGKLKAIAVRIEKNDYYKANPIIAAISAGIIEKMSDFIKLQSVAIEKKDDDSKSRAAVSGKEITYKLNDLFQTLDQETMLAREEVASASGKQGDFFAQSATTNDILVANSQLVALGLRVTGDTNRLFTLDSIVELGRLDLEIRTLFSKINSKVQSLEISLTRLNAMEELKILREAAASLATVREEIYSGDGIISALRNKLNAIEQANIAAAKLHAIVIKQSSEGNKDVSGVQQDQVKAIAAINSMVSSSLSRIIGIGSVAIIIGIIFGLWIYRSVLPPLRVVLDAIRSQQEQGQDKARLAEAVASGDLSREVLVSEALTIESTQISNDEMGMVLHAVVGMSEAQVALDRAFARMTASLRSNRDEEVRRDRLKSGLYELNKILRGEHSITELGDGSLAFLAAFLGAGVGIIYLNDEKNGMLQTCSTYAISKTGRLQDGFRLGEGVPGQVALERKTICLKAVPPDYLRITSALGAADPLNIVVMPIMYNDSLAGVLELGSFRQFGDDDVEFLTQAVEEIAIAINVNRSHQLVSELLKATQEQAEELRVQQEELQQTNEELHERATILAEKQKFNIY